jgi:hypothetical protein
MVNVAPEETLMVGRYRVIFSAAFVLLINLISIVAPSSSFASSRVLVVSDVDDTIKHSHVRSAVDTGLNALWDFKSFPGMADLYREIKQQSEVNIFYVSNAPTSMMHSRHLRFLQTFRFPQPDNLITRPSVTDDKFKFTTIMNLVEQENPQILILVGDNGESDPLYFQALRESLAPRSIQIYSYVHMVYSSTTYNLAPLSADDIPYVTPLEIGLHLYSKGVLTENGYDAISSELMNKLRLDLSDFLQSKTFPDWQDCVDFKWPENLPEKPSEDLEKIKQRIKIRCS